MRKVIMSLVLVLGVYFSASAFSQQSADKLIGQWCNWQTNDTTIIFTNDLNEDGEPGCSIIDYYQLSSFDTKKIKMVKVGIYRYNGNEVTILWKTVTFYNNDETNTVAGHSKCHTTDTYPIKFSVANGKYRQFAISELKEGYFIRM